MIDVNINMLEKIQNIILQIHHHIQIKKGKRYDMKLIHL